MASAPTTATTQTASTSQNNNIQATQAANAAYVAANPNVFGSSASTTPTTPSTSAPLSNTIGSQQLSSSQQIQLPPPVQSPDTSDGIVAGAQQTSKSVQDYINQLTPTQPTAVDQEQQELLNNVSTLTSEDTGKNQALINAQNASGATQDQQDLTNLNNQLLTKTASYNQQFANLGGNNSVETSAVLNAQTAGLKKAQSADIGLLTAQIQAKQGDLTLAMNTAQQAVNAQYSTIEDNIKTTQAQLAALAPALDAEQKTQAAAQQAYLQEQQDAVEDQKQTQTQIYNVALQAAQAGASSDVIAQINQSPDVISAIAAAAPSLGTAAQQKLQQDQFDENIQLQQLLISKQNANTDAENAATNADIKDIQLQQLQQLTSPQNILTQAQQYQTSGKVTDTQYQPYEGAIASVAASLPKTPGMIYSSTTGVTPTNLDSKTEANIQALYSIVNTALPNLTTDYSSGSKTTSVLGFSSEGNYSSDVTALNSALAALQKAGVVSQNTTGLPTNISILNRGSISSKITDLASNLSAQLSSYLGSNNLSIAGFSDQNDLETNGGLDDIFNSTLGSK